MKLLFDQNLSPRLINRLPDAFAGCAHVSEFNLQSAFDGDVWTFARENDFALVSKDSDFTEFSMLLGHPPKLIWIRLGNCTTNKSIELFESSSDVIQQFCDDPDTGVLELF